MYIQWYGQSCFKIQSGEKVILIDPYSPRQAGLRGPNFKAAIVLLTNPFEANLCKKNLKEESFLINEAGEYEIKDIFIYGITTKKKTANKIIEHTIYNIEVEGIKIGVLGAIDYIPAADELEQLDGVHLLLIPVGGKEVLTPEKAADLIKQIGSKIVVPSCYKIPGLKPSLLPIDNFLREIGRKKVEQIEKLSIHAKDLAEEEMKIVVLQTS